jgi:hypothetical protein
MRILRLSRYNLQPLEDELDRIGLKHGIEPRIRGIPPVDLFDADIMFDYGDDDD